jgi:hypothetical protein
MLNVIVGLPTEAVVAVIAQFVVLAAIKRPPTVVLLVFASLA